MSLCSGHWSKRPEKPALEQPHVARIALSVPLETVLSTWKRAHTACLRQTKFLRELRGFEGIPRTGQTLSLLVCFENKRALAKWLGCIILLVY